MIRRMIAPARRKRLLSWGLAIAALAFVAYAVPVRDQCVDPAQVVSATPGAPAAKPRRVPLSREGNECILHASSGDRRLGAKDCAALACEPGLGSALLGAKLGWL